MSRSDARRALAERNPWKRLAAARELARAATPDDLELLRGALRVETVPWVRDALREAIARATAPLIPSLPDAQEGIDQTLDEVHSRAVRETSQRLVHELRTILGSAKFVAQRELAAYDGSRTKIELDRLSDALRAIDALAQAASAPVMADFDFGGSVEAVAIAIRDGSQHEIRPAGPVPLMAKGDRGLVELIVRNAVSNAVEATPDAAPVVVNWGETDRDLWVAVLDEGVGIPADNAKLFEIGSSTKQGHMGIGLATARTAARSLRGVVVLERRREAGTRFEFRWPKSTAQ